MFSGFRDRLSAEKTSAESVLRIEENKMINFKQRLKASAKSKQGFTLVELIVVLVILAILAAFTIPAMLGFVEDAKGKAAIAEAREVYLAAQMALSEICTDGQVDTPDIYLLDLKVKDLLINDIKLEVVINEDGSGHTDVEFSQGSKPYMWDGIKGVLVGIELGEKNTDEEAKIKSVQYVNQSKEYLVTITPGGAAEVTKLK